MRKGLIVLLGLGVVLGYGSAIARVAHHRHGCQERWSESRGDDSYGCSRWNAPPVPGPTSVVVAPAAAPQAAAAPIIVAPAAAAPAPAAAPLVIVIPINGFSQAGSPLLVPMPAPATAVVPSTSASPSVGPQ